MNCRLDNLYDTIFELEDLIEESRAKRKSIEMSAITIDLYYWFQIKSNRESGFGRYDVMLIPADRKKDCAYIIEFKVQKPLKEQNLEETRLVS